MIVNEEAIKGVEVIVDDRMETIIQECLKRIRHGESPESCLASYPDIREELASLLRVALAVSDLSKVAPAEESVDRMRGRLMAHIRQARVQSEPACPVTWLKNAFSLVAKRISSCARPRMALIVALAVVLALLSSVFSWTNPWSPTTKASPNKLIILSGNPEVRKPGSTEFQLASDYMSLSADTRVRTGPDTSALLTFFDGSSVTLEPGSDLEIQSLLNQKGEPSVVRLKQWVGTTWSCAAEGSNPASSYQIETPAANIVVRGAAFTTNVKESGATKVTASEGIVNVTSTGGEARLTDNTQTEVKTDSAPSPVQTAPAPSSEILITIEGPAVASVTDATGASTGALPGGTSFRQIPGSKSFQLAPETQIIVVPEPITGKYTITLRYVDSGMARLNILGKTEGNTVFSHDRELEAAKDGSWQVQLETLIKDDGHLAIKGVGPIEPLKGKGLEKLASLSPEATAIPTNGVYAAELPAVDRQEVKATVREVDNSVKNNTDDTQANALTTGPGNSASQGQGNANGNALTAGPSGSTGQGQGNANGNISSSVGPGGSANQNQGNAHGKAK